LETAYLCTPNTPCTAFASLEGGIVRFLDDAGGTAAHDLAQLDRRDVGTAFVHPAAHGGVERDVFDAHAELARIWLWHGPVLDREVFAFHHASRPAGELDHAVAHRTPHLDVSAPKSKIVSDRSAWFRSWNVNLALDLSNRAGFTLQPPHWLSGKMIQSEAILL
jgi:hypothetical protein